MKIGLFGIGHLGKIHLNCLRSTPFEIVGFFDPDNNEAQKVVEQFKIRRFESESDLINACQAVDIVTPTAQHFEIAMQALDQGRHIFIEKPITKDLSQAELLVKKVNNSGLVAQVGHVERYNPAFTALEPGKFQPMFIEAHRLATFNPRGTDVSVILDLMIHDLDLIMNLVNKEVVDIQANGINVISDSADICNARLTFSNGCVANVTSSRISMKNMRKIRLFQENAYITIDFLAKESQIITLEDQYTVNTMGPIETNKGKRYLAVTSPLVKDGNAVVDELNDFYNSINNKVPPKVSINDGYRALMMAFRIEKVLKDQLY